MSAEISLSHGGVRDRTIDKELLLQRKRECLNAGLKELAGTRSSDNKSLELG